MKRSMFVLLSLLAIAALSACAPKGTPTPSVADLQATAMANAQTQIALTAASIPTATPLPPTALPTPIPVLPTEIPQQPIVAAPELGPTAAPAVIPDDISSTIPGDASLSSDNPCNAPLSKMKGPQVQVTFKNTTKGNVSLYLYSYTTTFGCGVGDVTIAPLESVTATTPKACYDFYGWISGPKDSTPAGYGCLNFDQTVVVRPDDIVFRDQ